MTSLDRRKFNRSLLAVPAAALLGTGLGSLAPAAASGAPSDWNARLLTGQANGRLMHQTRAGDGTWQPSWNEVDANGTVYYVSCAGISRDLHVVATNNNGTPDHCVRKGIDGTWTAFSPIPSISGPTTGAPHVATTSINRQLHVFATAGGNLYHTVRYEDGSWWNSWKLLRTFGSISGIATTRVGTTIDTAVVTGGEILHSIRSSGGTWSGWGNIEGAAGEVGEIHEVALAGFGAQLEVIALTGSYELYRGVRNADGTWQQFRRMTAFVDYKPMAISAANVGGELQFAFIDFTTAGQIIRHRIRRTDGSWGPITSVPTTGLTASPGELALTGTL